MFDDGLGNIFTSIIFSLIEDTFWHSCSQSSKVENSPVPSSNSSQYPSPLFNGKMQLKVGSIALQLASHSSRDWKFPLPSDNSKQTLSSLQSQVGSITLQLASHSSRDW